VAAVSGLAKREQSGRAALDDLERGTVMQTLNLAK
jgi:hypothetical protein